MRNETIVTNNLLDHLISDLCDKAVVSSESKLLCWAFALPEQIKNERWLPVDVCTLIGDHLALPNDYKSLKTDYTIYEPYILAPGVTVDKLTCHQHIDERYMIQRVSISLDYSTHIGYSIIGGELLHVSYSKELWVGYCTLSRNVNKCMSGKFEHNIYADGLVATFVEGDEAAAIGIIPVQILNLKYEFPAIWFNESLTEELFNRVRDACMEFDSAAGITVTRDSDHNMHIAKSEYTYVEMRKLEDGTFTFSYSFADGEMYGLDYDKLEGAFIALLKDYF